MVKVLITSKNGYPVAKIFGIVGTPFRVHNNRIRSVKIINDYVLVPIDYWYEFINLNKERFNLQYVDDVEIDKNSINYYGFSYYYGGKTVYRTRLTENFVNDFFNHDCSQIKRYEPNINGGVNMLGMKLAEFETIIYDGDYPISIDEDTTIEECEAILKGCHPSSKAAQVLNAHISALKCTDLEIIAIEKEVEEYEATLSDIFERYSQLIIDFKRTLPTYGLDCGFTQVTTTDKDMQDKYQKLISHGKRNSAFVRVEFPDDYFNASHSNEILRYVKEISQNDIIDTISVSTILD